MCEFYHFFPRNVLWLHLYMQGCNLKVCSDRSFSVNQRETWFAVEPSGAVRPGTGLQKNPLNPENSKLNWDFVLYSSDNHKFLQQVLHNLQQML